MSDIDEVKFRLNIIDIIGAKITLKKAGRHWKALCPFHNEKTPSFIVSPERQMWKCFGCGKGGSVIDFVMEYEHLDFIEALEELAEKAGVKLERRAADTPEAKLKDRLYQVNHLASEYFQYILTSHALGQNARDYLKHRGITDKAIKTFGLGYSPNSWDALAKFLRKKGYEQKLLEQAGLLVPSARGGYDRFRGRVMFTLRDHRGNVVGFSGRLLDPEVKDAKYINTSETPVYSKSKILYGLDVTKAAIQKANEAIVMEGEFDVISLFQAGMGNAVAIKGSSLTEGHVNLLRRFTERLVFALDGDVAGDSASRRGIEIADKAGLDMRVVQLPNGKDPDESVRENPGLFKKAVERAMPIYDYFLVSTAKRFDASTAFGKRKISDELLPILAGIDNVIVQSHYIKKLGNLLDTSVDAIGDALHKLATVKKRLPMSPSLTTEGAKTRSEKLAVYILALILQGETRGWFDALLHVVDIAHISHPAVTKILIYLRDYLQATSGDFVIDSFVASLPKELVSTLDEAYLWDMGEIIDDEKRKNLEWQRALRELERDDLHQKIRLLTQRLHAREGEEAEVAVRKQLAQLSTSLKQLENPS